ncbi:MAG: efflux RND transporter periplasmic adaptor subunit [Byssovorax sp.]
MVGRKGLQHLSFVLGIAALVAAIMAWRIKIQPTPLPRYVLGQITNGDVIVTIQATGQVQPVTQVQVGAQLSGRVTKVFVDFNSRVKSGDVLAELDPTFYGAAVDQNRAQLDSARAAVRRAEAVLLAAKRRFDRANKLSDARLASQAELDATRGVYDGAVADLAASRAGVPQARADLVSSRTNLEHTRICSPIDGVVVSRSIEQGQTVAASFQAPTLFIIAQDLRKMRVLADIDEADVGKLEEGMIAQINVDAFPGEKFKGAVSQVRFNPSSQAGVITYAAVVEVENPDMKLRPGMTATLSIHAAEARGATCIPNAALRFKPLSRIDKEGKKIPQELLSTLDPGIGRIYLLTNEIPGAEAAAMLEVSIGITDGTHTVLKTSLKDVKNVVIGENVAPVNQ